MEFGIPWHPNRRQKRLILFSLAISSIFFVLEPVFLHSCVTKSQPVTFKTYSPETFNPNSPDALEYINDTPIATLYAPGFTIPNPDLCPQSGGALKLLIVVSSARENFPERMAIRQTWGHFAQRKDIALAFIVGRPEKPPTLPSSIEPEAELYDDVIVGNFVDSYANLTLKSTAMLEWVTSHCSQAGFVVKADDDVFLNVPKILELAEAWEDEKKTVFGLLFESWHPVRNKRDRNYISPEVYAPPFLPDYLRGPCYVITGDLVKDLFEKALESPFFILEDAFFTGFLVQAVGATRVNIDAAFTFRNRKCNFQNDHWMGTSRVQDQFDLWKKYLDGRLRCL